MQQPRKRPSTQDVARVAKAQSLRGNDATLLDQWDEDSITALAAPTMSRMRDMGKQKALKEAAADGDEVDVRQGFDGRRASKVHVRHSKRNDKAGAAGYVSSVENVTAYLAAPVAERSIVRSVALLEERVLDQPESDLVAPSNGCLWILNTHYSLTSSHSKFFVTYIDRFNDWHSVTISIRYPDVTIPAGFELDVFNAPTAEEASNVIYAEIRDHLDEQLLHGTVTNVAIWTDEYGSHVIDASEDVETAGRRLPAAIAKSMFGLSSYYEREIRYYGQLDRYISKVSIEGAAHIYKRVPISGSRSVESYIYELHALYATLRFPHTTKLGGVVFSNTSQHITGFITSEPSRQKCLERTIKAAIVYWGRIPWSVRLDWAKQLISAVHAYHSLGFVHGNISLLTVLLDYPDDWIPSTVRDPALATADVDSPRPDRPVAGRPTRTILLPTPTLASTPSSTPPAYVPPDYDPRDYVAPEHLALFDAGLLKRSLLNTQSDLYALGQVLWALAMHLGRPFTGDLRWKFRDLKEEVTWAYKDVLYSCLDQDPARRLSAGKLLEILEESDVEDNQTFDDDRVGSSGVRGRSRV